MCSFSARINQCGQLHMKSVVAKNILTAIVLTAAFSCLPAYSSAAANRGAFNLAVTTHLGDVHSFQQGDIISFYVSLAKDAYLTVVYQDAGNHLYLLIPNALYRDNFFKAGLFIPIPNEQNPFQFRITPPFGKETLWVFASDQAFADLPVQATEGDTTRLSGDITSVRNALKNHSRGHNALFEEVSLTLYTSAPSWQP